MTADQIRSYTEQLRGSSSKSPEVDTIWVLSEIAAQLAELNAQLKDVIDPREGTGWGAEVRVTTGSCGYEG